MENKQPQVLIIDDEENMRHMLSVLLRRENFQVFLAGDGKQGLAAVSQKQVDLVLCDVRMPVMDGLEFLAGLRKHENDMPVVMMSAFGTVDLAVEAMKNGADDFITKPFKGEEVVLILKKVLQQQELRRENKQLRQRVNEIYGGEPFAHLLGESTGLRKVIAQASKIARYKSTVLITGESGTGKELLAQGIHRASKRTNKPFVAVNCGSIPENLMESEFFGYVRGAFTGADRNKDGLFSEAEGGTLFLDEIGELPLAMQVKLLRVLQEGEYRPVGSGHQRKTDVRVLAATSRNLEDEISQGKFREDLFFRLNVVPLHLPPLRERIEDVPILADFFVQKTNKQTGTKVRGLEKQTLRLLLRHQWPGNIRELENTIERAVLFAEGELLLPEDLPDNFLVESRQRRINDLFGTLSLKKGKKILEQRLIERALAQTGGNKSKAAELLEISYPSLLAKIKQYKI